MAFTLTFLPDSILGPPFCSPLSRCPNREAEAETEREREKHHLYFFRHRLRTRERTRIALFLPAPQSLPIRLLSSTSPRCSFSRATREWPRGRRRSTTRLCAHTSTSSRSAVSVCTLPCFVNLSRTLDTTPLGHRYRFRTRIRRNPKRETRESGRIAPRMHRLRIRRSFVS